MKTEKKVEKALKTWSTEAAKKSKGKKNFILYLSVSQAGKKNDLEQQNHQLPLPLSIELKLDC